MTEDERENVNHNIRNINRTYATLVAEAKAKDNDDYNDNDYNHNHYNNNEQDTTEQTPVCVCTDGSGGKEAHPMLRRCGWAWVQLRGISQHAAEAGALPGARQSVPRSELFALIRALENPEMRTLPMHLYTDHQNWVRRFEQGKSDASARRRLQSHQDLWMRFWQAYDSRPATAKVGMWWVNAHVKSWLDMNPSLPPQAYEGNRLADLLADEAAAVAQLPAWIAKEVKEKEEMSQALQRRFVAITARIIDKFRWDPCKMKPRKVPQRYQLKDFVEAWQDSEHEPEQKGRRLHCTVCWARSTGSKTAWLKTTCTRSPGNEAAGGPHTSHTLQKLAQGTIFCNVCGVWATRRWDLIKQACVARVRSPFHGYALMRMQVGQQPVPPRGQHEDESSDGLVLVEG